MSGSPQAGPAFERRLGRLLTAVTYVAVGLLTIGVVLMLLAGISESPEFQTVSRSGSGVRVPLATYAEALAVFSYQRMQAELARAVPTG